MTLYSRCCGAPDRLLRKVLDMNYSEMGICPKCGEHSSFVEYKEWSDAPNYEVGTDGSIWSLNYAQMRIRKELKQGTTKKGYKCVHLATKGKDVSMLVHRLVAISFIPNPENKKTVNHKNGVRDDNRVENLEWATQKENVIHAFKVNGRKCFNGESNPKAKITKPDVFDIRKLRADGVPAKKVAESYNISITQVSNIAKCKNWVGYDLTNDEIIICLKNITNRKTDLISITIRKAIKDKASHLEIFDYIKSQAKDNLRMMSEVLGIELTEKIMSV